MCEPLDPSRLVDRLRADERVAGVVRLAHLAGRTRLLVVTTWDGRDALAPHLPELGSLVLDSARAVALQENARLHMLAPTGERLELLLERIGDLKPSAEGEDATPLLDPKGLMAQWVAWSIGRRRVEPTSADVASERARKLLALDDALRAFTSREPGTARMTTGSGPQPLRHDVATRLRALAASLPAGDAEQSIARRIEQSLRAMPRAAAGLRVSGPGARERFLSVADDEGFRGDRMLFDAAEAHIADTAGRPPVFECGFALATFDQVEARYALGEAVGGCKPPLVPGVVVGVGVTPADDLELWAAPAVREPTCDAACVADDGTRVTVRRDAGKDALLEALMDAVGSAVEALPSLLRRARGAHYEHPADPEIMVRSLSLPRSFVLAATTHGALTPGTTRLLSALAIARAATDMEPVVARKLELAAGRLLLGAAEADEGCTP